MPVDYATEVLYSIPELSQRFQVPQEELVIVVTEHKFTQHSINGETYVKKDELKNLIDELFPFVNAPQKNYDIPEYLKSCIPPRGDTLVKMYQEFTFPASVSPSQGDFLRTLVRNFAPKNIV